MNAKVIAIAMQKGGAGKTTTCANLGLGLAQEGKGKAELWRSAYNTVGYPVATVILL